MIHLNLYDNKEIDIESEKFRDIVAESVKNMVIRDWDQIVHVDTYVDEWSSNYHADITIDM